MVGGTLLWIYRLRLPGTCFLARRAVIGTWRELVVTLAENYWEAESWKEDFWVARDELVREINVLTRRLKGEIIMGLLNPWGSNC